MKYIIVLVFIAVFICFDSGVGYARESQLHTHITYMFQHANIVHLTINSIAFLGIFRTMEKFVNKWRLLPSIITASFAASFMAMHDMPTVGASGMIYAMIGMFLGLTIFAKDIKITDTKKYLLFLFTVMASLLISLIKHNSNFTLHVISLGFGFVITSFPRLIKLP